MAEIAPIRPFDEAAALDWLRSQPGGRTNMPVAELGRRWGWHRQRAGRRLKAWQKAGLVTRRGNTVMVTVGSPVAPRKTDPVTHPVTRPVRVTRAWPVPVTPLAGIDIAAYVAVIVLAGCAAFFSVKGMVVLFPGAPVAVVAMTVAMEAAKLVTAGWLASRWRATAWLWRLVLVGLVTGLAIINATGVYAQLVSAHVGERGERESYITTQDAELAGRIEVASHVVADLDARVSQIDAAIAEATRRGRTNAALAAMEGQHRTRAGLVDERNREAGTLAALKAERASVAAKGRQAEVEAAPIRYVTELLGGGEDSERAIRWLIALMVVCCDPLAIALTAAVAGRNSDPRRW